MQTLNIAEQSNAELKNKLANEEHARKSADSALEGAQRQAEDQRKLTREATDQLAASNEQLATLRKQLEEAQKLRDQAEKAKAEVEKAKAEAEKEKDEAEQHGYDFSIAETEEALRAEVPTICRAYYVQTWEEALNRAGIFFRAEKARKCLLPFSHTSSRPCPQPKGGSPSNHQASRRCPASESSPSQSVEAGQKSEVLQGTSLNKVAEAS